MVKYTYQFLVNDSKDTVSNQLTISYPIALFNARPYVIGWLTQYKQDRINSKIICL